MNSFYGDRHYTDHSMPAKSGVESDVFITAPSKKSMVIARNQITPSLAAHIVKISKQESTNNKSQIKADLTKTKEKAFEEVKKSGVRIDSSNH